MNSMRWEDQELNYASPEGKFLEVFVAKFALIAKSERREGKYLVVDQAVLDQLASEAGTQKKEKARCFGLIFFTQRN